MPRPNWFFAFPVDGAFVSELPTPPSHFRRFHPDDVHLTLAFLGGCGEAAALAALAALDRELLAAPRAGVTISLGEVVPMGSGPYSALSALLERGRRDATDLVAGLRDLLSDAALVRREKRAPQPHVTLARPARRAPPHALDEGLEWAKRVDVSRVSARLDRVCLYTWAEGARHHRLFRVVEHRALA